MGSCDAADGDGVSPVLTWLLCTMEPLVSHQLLLPSPRAASMALAMAIHHNSSVHVRLHQ